MTSSGSLSIFAIVVLVAQSATMFHPPCLVLAWAGGTEASPPFPAGGDPSPLLASSGRLWMGPGAVLDFAPQTPRAPQVFGAMSSDSPPNPTAETAAAAPAALTGEALVLAEPELTAGRTGKGGNWWVWVGSAALLGAFITGFAQDLANDQAAESNELPYFPDTP